MLRSPREVLTGRGRDDSPRVVTLDDAITAGQSGTRVLDSIADPGDLLRHDQAELEQLAAEIRDTVVRSVACSGGHLSSNLGVVELTLSLHRAFRSPRDLILWDTGHQAYPHKLVTGRQDAFDRLRQRGGLSGYPSRRESPHDWIENSHASPILSYADGCARAVALLGLRRRVVAVVGDGSLTGGMAYEALSNIGFYGTRVAVVLNDNGRSYAPTVSRLSAAGHPGGAIAARAFFEALGFSYDGPIDGHDLAALEPALCQLRDAPGPAVLHVLTEKGRGYGPALRDPDKRLHDCGPFADLDTGPSSTALSGYTKVFADEIVRLARQDPNVVAITAAMPGSTGLLPFARELPDRCLDVGIAEQHAVTTAAGMAMVGLRPVVAIYSTFFTRAFDQVNLDVGLHGLPVVFVLDRAGITGDDGPSHNGVLDLALCLKVPGLTVFAPSSSQELRVMLGEALRLPGPSAIRFPKGASYEVDPGSVGSGLRARCVRRGGSSVCIVAVGTTLEAAETAGDILSTRGIDTTIWDARVVKPLDPDMITDAARHRVVVTVEDGIEVGGAGWATTAALNQTAGSEPGPRVVTLGIPARFFDQAKPADIRSSLGLDAEGIAATVAKTHDLESASTPGTGT
jgi:1-deoxy-D-xylulose-5-phosphate synthase